MLEEVGRCERIDTAYCTKCKLSVGIWGVERYFASLLRCPCCPDGDFRRGTAL